MIRALLRDENPKTQTRRAMRPQPHPAFLARGVHGVVPQWPHQDGVRWFMQDGMSELVKCPYGKPGDRLVVRETFYAWGRWETRFSAKKGRDEWHFVDMTLESGKEYRYAASMAGDNGPRQRGGVTPQWWKRPAIFMPRRASRITLEITAVRVERLSQISEDDAVDEGITRVGDGFERWHVDPDAPIGQPFTMNPVLSYRGLWESINGPGSWDANPWVWVVEFKRVTP